MIGTYKIIKTDVFDIASRIKEIDASYFVAFNYKTKKFEVHSNDNKRGASLCLTLPYNRLDNRTLIHARRTRAERVKELIKEIEENNKKIERAEEKKRWLR